MLTVTITQQEYDSLIKDRRWLYALEDAGVDNWEGIDEAVRILREQTEDKEDED